MARSFNGTSDKILTANAARITSGNKLTIAAWVKNTNWTAGGLRAVTLGGGNVAYLGTSGNAVVMARFLVFITTTGNQTFDFGTGLTFTNGVWQHLAATYDGDGDRTMRGYLDGAAASDTKVVAGVNAIGWGAAGKASIGTQDGGGGSFWNGSLGEIAVWNVALTAEQIRALARGVPPWRIGVQPTLWLPLYGAASPEAELSGGGLTGTLTGTAQVDHPPVAPPGGFDTSWLSFAATPALAALPAPTIRIPNPRVGPMALRHLFRRAYSPPSVVAAATTPVSSVASLAVEALQQVAATIVDPVEAPAGIAGSGIAPAEALQAILAIGSDPIEAAQGIASTAALVLESLGGVAGTGTLPLEELQAIATPLQNAFEALAGLAAANAEPIEAAAGVKSVDALTLEALAGVTASAVDPVEAQGNVPVAQTLALAFEALAAASASGNLPAEATSALSAAAAGPLEAVQALTRASSAPVESLAGVSRSATVALEALAQITASPALPFEARLAAALVGLVVAAFDPPIAARASGFDPPDPSGADGGRFDPPTAAASE